MDNQIICANALDGLRRLPDSCTTGAVAKWLGRRYIGIDINPEYCRKAQERIDEIPEPILREED